MKSNLASPCQHSISQLLVNVTHNIAYRSQIKMAIYKLSDRPVENVKTLTQINKIIKETSI